MKRLLAVIVFLALFGCFLSCGNDNPVSYGKPQLSAEEFFPSAVGLLWTYEIHNVISDSRDTVLVSVSDSMVMDDGEIRFEWKYNFGDSVLIGAVSLVDSSLRIYDNFGDTIPAEHFILPPEIGKTWTGTGTVPDDTSIVVDSATITAEAGTFRGTYRIDREWGRDFEGGSFQRSTFLCPKVGMVFRRDVRTGTDGGGPADTVSHVVWRLISYNTHTFTIDQFPNKEGTEWVYEFFDSLVNEYDTVTVTVGDTISAWWEPKGEWRIWTYRHRDSVYRQQVVKYGDRIWLTSIGQDVLSRDPLRFPLAVGRYWEYIVLSDLGVNRKDTIVVPSGEFGGGFRDLSRYYLGGADISTWLVPGVGIVCYDFNSAPERYVRWTLLSYNIVR